MRTESFKTMTMMGIVQTLLREGKLTFVQALDPLYPEQGTYCFDSIPVLTSVWSSSHINWLSEGRNIAESYECGVLEFLMSIAEKDEPIPKYWFLNGKCRITELRILASRLDNRLMRKLPFTVRWVEDVTANWGRMGVSGKRILSRWFDEDTGECNYTHIQVNVLGFGYKVANPGNYRPCCPLLGPYVIHKTEPFVDIVMYRGVTYSLTELEKAHFNAAFIECSACGTWEKRTNTVFSLCPICVGDSPKELRGYSERATSVFEFISKSKIYSGRYLGVELEYERKGVHSLAEDLHLLHRNLKGHAIFKRDGSLSQGIEICTRPASADIHIEEFTKMFEDELCMSSLEVKSSCGMHVHISRKGMSPLALGKMLKFMQSKYNKEFLQLIAGREDNNYCKLGTDPMISAHFRGLENERYRGLNLQNENTAEVRIFRTPDTMDKFIKNIEFVTALTDFVQPANSGVKECTHEHLTKFVLANRRSYPSLHKSFKGVV